MQANSSIFPRDDPFCRLLMSDVSIFKNNHLQVVIWKIGFRNGFFPLELIGNLSTALNLPDCSDHQTLLMVFKSTWFLKHFLKNNLCVNCFFSTEAKLNATLIRVGQNFQKGVLLLVVILHIVLPYPNRWKEHKLKRLITVLLLVLTFDSTKQAWRLVVREYLRLYEFLNWDFCN